MDYAQLAQQAIDVLKATEAEAVKVLADKAPAAAAAGAAAVWGWLKGKLTKPAAGGALEEAAKEPKVEENWEALRIQIVKAMKEDTTGAFARELAALLPAAGGVAAGTRQSARVAGDNNVVGQQSGTGNQINVGKR